MYGHTGSTSGHMIYIIFSNLGNVESMKLALELVDQVTFNYNIKVWMLLEV